MDIEDDADDAGGNPASAALPPALLRALAGVRSAGIITGAGVSVESGIQTYRGKGGIYDDPEEGDRTVEALSGHTLAADPARTWAVVARLARMSHGAAPNPAHRAIVAIEERVPRFVLLTQNVDGLHTRAGSRNVIDIHGDVFATVCTSCGQPGRLGDVAAIESVARDPVCTACGGLVRPDVVLFGEALPMHKYQRIHAELQLDPPDLVVIAGTTALFPYIVEPVLHARARGRLTVEVNPEETMLSGAVSHSLRGRAGSVLPAIAAALHRPQDLC